MIGALDAAPGLLLVRRARCGPGLEGLLTLALDLPGAAHPAQGLLQPVHTRLTRDALPRGGPPELPAIPEGHVWVLQDLERLTAAGQQVIERWLQRRGSLPLLLVAREPHALHERLRELHGDAAVQDGGPVAGGLADLPEDAIALALLVAEHGPVTLEHLAGQLGKTPLRVKAALLQARLRGLQLHHLDGGRLGLSRSTLTALGALEEQPPALPDAPGDRAELAVAIGAWDLAIELYDRDPACALRAAAVCWARGDLAGAAERLAHVEDGPDRRRAEAALAWDGLAPIPQLAACLHRLASPEKELALAASHGRSGDIHEAAEVLTDLLPSLEGYDRVDALHLLAKLPLLGESSLVLGRRFAGEAYQALPPDDRGGKALLIETTARLTLRARNVREAAKQFERALPDLELTDQAIPFARAVAGLAESADLVGHTDELLDWLQRAIQANRERPHGLSWCHAALDTLMQRVEVDDGPTLSSLQRQSLELASLRADRPDSMPLEAL